MSFKLVPFESLCSVSYSLPVAQLREAMEAVASGRPWKEGAACRQQFFFILFNYKILSRFVAANDTALNTIRPCFTANNNQLGL